MSTSSSSSRSATHVHLQQERIDHLSSLSCLKEWPIDLIRLVTDYMSVQIWIAIEEFEGEISIVKVLNLTSLQSEMKNKTFRYVSVPLTNGDEEPILRKGVSTSSSLNQVENGLRSATSEWLYLSKSEERSRILPTYCIINNVLLTGGGRYERKIGVLDLLPNVKTSTLKKIFSPPSLPFSRFAPSSCVFTLPPSSPHLLSDNKSNNTTEDDGVRWLIVGGYNTAWSQLTSCTAYAPSLNKWVDMPSLNVARSQSTIAVWKDGRIFMFGGFTLEGSLDSVEMFDITQWKWKNMKKLPITTALAAAVVVHDGILLLGGLGDGNKKVYHYDVDNDNWQLLKLQLPTRSHNFSGFYDDTTQLLLPTRSHNFSGFYDDTTQLLHIIHGDSSTNHDYIKWPKRSRDSPFVSKWNRLFPSGKAPISPIHSFIVDI